MTAPSLACVGPAQHGVRMHAENLAAHTPQARSLAGALEDVRPALLAEDSPVHLHFTDRLFGAAPALAARTVAEIAHRRPVSLTLHDIPQPSDGHAFAARRAAYADVVDRAHTVVVSSGSELAQLREHVPFTSAPRFFVSPLPIDAPEPRQWGAARGAAGADVPPSVAVLGFLYPGKGHDRVVEALAGLPFGVDVLALGRASDGHEDLVPELDAAARRHGHTFRTTGFLDDAALTRAAQRVTVAVVAPSHVSASGSVGRWIASGRKPLVTPHPYFAELAARAPWALTLTDDLEGSLRRALRDPASTWIDPGAWRTADLPSSAVAAAAQWEQITAVPCAADGAGPFSRPGKDTA
ncbi:glycosyltransferase family protein [Kocuria tytonis]|uniref:hypothetical protein n=1 Tax=Kocuria tytonis TaxID=2054280 RepID=UPI001F4894C2|nr:hypothetical protein [Kocuria tytonis]